MASLGYVGLQKGNAGVNAATGGTDPKEVIAAINKTLAAMLELDDGKPEKAIPPLRQVLTAQPSLYLAQYAMGFAFVQQGQYSEAIGYFHKAIELQPDSAFAHYAMGLSLMKTGDFKTSAIHLEVASERLPAFPPCIPCWLKYTSTSDEARTPPENELRQLRQATERRPSAPQRTASFVLA